MVLPALAAGARVLAGNATRKSAATSVTSGVKNVTREAKSGIQSNTQSFTQLKDLAENPNQNLPSINRLDRERKIRELTTEEEIDDEEIRAFLEADKALRLQQQQADTIEEENRIKVARKLKRQDFFASVRAARILLSPWTGGALIVMYVLQILFFFTYVGAIILIDTSITDIFEKPTEQIIAAQIGNETLQGIALLAYGVAFFFGLISMAYFYILTFGLRNVRPLSGRRSVKKWLYFILAFVGCVVPLHILPTLLPWVQYVIRKPA